MGDAREPLFDSRRPTHVLVDRDCETCRTIVAELERHGVIHRPERTTDREDDQTKAIPARLRRMRGSE